MIKRILLGFVSFLVILVVSVLTWVNRAPYADQNFYQQMDARMDSLALNFPIRSAPDSIQIGWSKVNLTPSKSTPLAGYGNRNPKESEGIMDSVFVRALVLDNGSSRKAMISADMLIIPPEVTLELGKRLQSINWSIRDVYLTASHTHSSIGGWAPGLVGTAIAGSYEVEWVEWIVEKMMTAIQSADRDKSQASLSYSELEVNSLVYNRLVGKRGIIDPFLKLISIQKDSLIGVQTFYGAHATCFGRHNHQVSGDYPGHLQSSLEQSGYDYAGFSAGAVASMGPNHKQKDRKKGAQLMSDSLTEQILLSGSLPTVSTNQLSMRSMRVPIELRDPAPKISENIALRPWIFEWAFGDYQAEIQTLQLNDLLMIGLPCDFSGEIAVELYEYARKKGLNLIITSFNGGYIGYVPKDEWYDLAKYEPRSMSWYGPDNGAYFTEIIKRLIDLSARED